MGEYDPALVIKFLALYTSGKNVIFWESPYAPFAGHCGYERLIKNATSKIGIEPGRYMTNIHLPYISEYDPCNENHATYVCLGCAQPGDVKCSETESRIKYHFESR
jgi:hypothetical protein